MLLSERHRGFTLIELLIAVAIVAILAAIAVPSYASFVNKGRITTAQSDLVALSLYFENQYQRVLAYPITDYENTTALSAAFTKWVPASDSSTVSFSSTASSASSYTLRATGLDARGISGCVITFTSSGNKTITNCDDYSSGDWL